VVVKRQGRAEVSRLGAVVTGEDLPKPASLFRLGITLMNVFAASAASKLFLAPLRLLKPRRQISLLREG
jgi:hypothetical protein